MIRYAELVKNRKLFQSFTGLRIEAFAKLLPAFEKAYEADITRRETQRDTPRQRQQGGGRTGSMPDMEDKLVFILV